MGLVVTLVVLGAVLLILEVFLPGIVAGVIGAGCLLAAVLVSYVKFGASGGNIMLVGVTVAFLAGMALWMRYFPTSRMARLFVSQRVIGNVDADKPELLHRTGQALTILRPSGMALIDGKRVDVVSEGPLIEPGTAVKVVAIEGLRVVVRAVDTTSSPGAKAIS
jgi:membrane-bound serine protease (ClpP class)